MNKKTFDIIKNLLAVTEQCRNAEHILYTLQRFTEPDEPTRDAFHTISQSLHRKELDAWRVLSTVALATTPEQQKEVRARAYRRFFNDSMSVMYLTDDLLEQPSIWPGSDEHELREWLRDNFDDDHNRD